MRIAFAGTPVIAVPSLKALLAAGHEVVAVITRPDAPAGRGKKLMPSPVARAATEMGLAVVKPQHPRDTEFVDHLVNIAPDACAVVAYGALLPQRVLDIPEHGWVNLHFSLLPRWRGAAPVQRALMAGDTVSGVSTFRIVKQLDAGPLYRRLEVPVAPDEIAGQLLDRLAEIGDQVLVDTFHDIVLGRQPEPQSERGVTLAAKVTVDDARIAWTRPAEELVRLIRGTSPAPGAWTVFEARRFKVLGARQHETVVGNTTALAPGELGVHPHALLIGTGQGVLELTSVQAFGKKVMNAADWARGAKPVSGTRLGEQSA